MSPSAITKTISPKRILVVDDEPPVAGAIKLVLTTVGHIVETAENVEQAERMFTAGNYDLTMTDYALGKLTGLDLAKFIKEKSPKHPIVMVTAYAETLALRQDRLGNVDLVIAKPFSIEELRGALNRFFPEG